MRASRLPRTTRRLLIVGLVSVVFVASLFFVAPAETEAAGRESRTAHLEEQVTYLLEYLPTPPSEHPLPPPSLFFLGRCLFTL